MPDVFSHLCHFAGNNRETKHHVLKMSWTSAELVFSCLSLLSLSLPLHSFLQSSYGLAWVYCHHILPSHQQPQVPDQSFWAVITHCKLELFSCCVTLFFNGFRTILMVSMCKTPLSKWHLQVLAAHCRLALLGREETFNLYLSREEKKKYPEVVKHHNEERKMLQRSNVERSNTMSFLPVS